MPQSAPLTPDDKSLLKSLYQAVGDAPLEPGNPRYEPVYSGLGPDDPVALLHQHIDWNDTHSVQMLSGFSGSGKTTELFRLRGRLRESGYRVVYADALDYLNPSQPIDITELLIVIAGSFSDGLKAEGIDVSGEGYWTRLKNYLTKTNVELQGFDAGSDGVDLKFKLQTTPSFRAKLRDSLTGRLGEIKRQVDLFLEDGIEAVRRESGHKCVFILDSLEQFRDPAISEEKVMQSVRDIFAHHLAMLTLPHLHAVYTVPPWLHFLMPNAVGMVVLPSIRQWNNDRGRTRYEPGWDLLRGAVARRFGTDGCARVFGERDERGHYPMLERLIEVCGGHFRDLLRLLREMLVRIRELPVGTRAVESAIAAVQESFLTIANDDAEWLDQIGKERASVLPTATAPDVNRLTRFLNTHLVLYLKNGEPWYDTHPLIRGEVAEIVERLKQLRQAGLESK